MDHSKKVNMAVIGVGNMGGSHVKDIATRLPNTNLAAVCDIDRERAERYAAEHHVPAFQDYRELLQQADLDAVVVATPHYAHTPISIAALEKGIHVLVEKPLAAHVNDGRKMTAAYEQARAKYPRIQFGIMFMSRTHAHWAKIKEILDSGQLGRLVRATWVVTDWYRTQAYYDGGGWRATWRGEGGGVLLNQCPHNLDLYQWFFGMPRRVAGFAHIGKYHDIEVEDEVTAYFEHKNGMMGHFIASTAESPGANQLEIFGEMGKLTFENGKITINHNERSMLENIRTSKIAFDSVPYQPEELPCEPLTDWGHWRVTQAFADAILTGAPLLVHASEGLNSLMLGNAILLSSFQGCPLELPMDGLAYETKLQELIKTSRYQKVVREANVDLSKSFR